MGEPQAAMRADSPPLEPPGVRVRSYGLLVRPYRRLSDSNAKRRSGRLVRAIGTPPAARRRATRAASSVAGGRSRYPRVPAVQRWPTISMESLTEKGKSAGLVA